MRKKGKLKYILILLGIVLVIFSIVVGYLVVNDLNQEDILKKELVNLANKDLLVDDYSVKVKTKGDYAYIEEIIKNYYKELSNNVKVINSYLNDQNLINILSIDNIKNDGPGFINSYNILEEVKENINESLNKIINLCNEDTIKNLVDKDKVDSYSYKLYLELMYTKENLEDFNDIKDEMQILINDLNTFLDKVEGILNLLNNNSNNWFIEKEELYFKTDSLVKEYNNLYNDLNNYVKERFSKYDNVSINPNNI